MAMDKPPDPPTRAVGKPHSRLTVRVRRDVLLDRAAFRLSSSMVKLPSPAEVERVFEETRTALELFEQRGWIAQPATYHEAPPKPSVIWSSRERSGSIRFASWKWEDGFVVRPEEPGAERFAGYARNRIARAAVLQHRQGDRPWLVCIHGWGMGMPGLDMRTFRAMHLHRDLGLNVAFVTLPMHGKRKPSDAGRMPPIPGADVLDNVHGLAQAAWDVRQLLAHLRSTTSQPIGLMGLSLGGYTTALVGALDHELAGAIVIVPAVDLGALMSENRDRVKHSAGSLPEDFDMLKRAMTPIAPLAMPPRVPADHCFIIAGTLDQFARASTQAMALAEHWGGADVHWFHGGHVGVFWAGGVQGAIDDALRRFDLLH